jgi:hypothetical protein
VRGPRMSESFFQASPSPTRSCGNRRHKAPRPSCSSTRASWAPRHRCGPYPKARCLFAVRVTSKACRSGKWDVNAGRFVEWIDHRSGVEGHLLPTSSICSRLVMGHRRRLPHTGWRRLERCQPPGLASENGQAKPGGGAERAPATVRSGVIVQSHTVPCNFCRQRHGRLACAISDVWSNLMPAVSYRHYLRRAARDIPTPRSCPYYPLGPIAEVPFAHSRGCAPRRGAFRWRTVKSAGKWCADPATR